MVFEVLKQAESLEVQSSEVLRLAVRWQSTAGARWAPSLDWSLSVKLEVAESLSLDSGVETPSVE